MCILEAEPERRSDSRKGKYAHKWKKGSHRREAILASWPSSDLGCSRCTHTHTHWVSLLSPWSSAFSTINDLQEPSLFSLKFKKRVIYTSINILYLCTDTNFIAHFLNWLTYFLIIELWEFFINSEYKLLFRYVYGMYFLCLGLSSHNFFLMLLMHHVLVAACRIFGCSIWDLISWPGIEPLVSCIRSTECQQLDHQGSPVFS